MEIITTNPERRDPGFSENKLDLGLGRVDNISSTDLLNIIVKSAKIIANEKTIGDNIQSTGEAFFPIFETADGSATCSLEVGFFDSSDKELSSFDITFSYFDEDISYLLNVAPDAYRIEELYLRIVKKGNKLIGGIYWNLGSMFDPNYNFNKIGVNLIHWTEGSKILDPNRNELALYNVTNPESGCTLIIDIPLRESSSTIDYAASSFVLYNADTGKRLFGTNANYTSQELENIDAPSINGVPFLLKRGTTIDGKIDARHITVPAKHKDSHKEEAGGHNWDVLERIRKAGLIQNKDGAEHCIGEMLNIDDLHYGVTRLSGYDKLDTSVISVEKLNEWLNSLGYDTDVISVGLFKNFVGYICRLLDNSYDPKILDFSLENSAHEFLFITAAGSNGTEIVFNTYRRDYSSTGYENTGIFGSETLLGYTKEDPYNIISDVSFSQLNSTQVTANIKMNRNNSEDSRSAKVIFKQINGTVPTGLPDIEVHVFQEGFVTEYGYLCGETEQDLVPVFEATGLTIYRDYNPFSVTRIIKPIVTENTDLGYHEISGVSTEVVLDEKAKSWSSLVLEEDILTISGIKNESSYKRTASGYLAMHDSGDVIIGRVPVTIIQSSVDGYLDLDDHSLNISKSGSTVSTTVRSNYPWTINIDTVPSWIEIPGFNGSRKAGNSVISFIVDENEDTDRSATIEFINDFGNTDELQITQLGKSGYLDIVGFPDKDVFFSMSPRTSGHYGRNIVDLTFNTDRPWLIEYKPSWIGINYTSGYQKQGYTIRLTYTGEGYTAGTQGDYISLGYFDSNYNSIISLRKIYIDLRSWGPKQGSYYTDSGAGAYMFGPVYSELCQGDTDEIYCIGNKNQLKSDISGPITSYFDVEATSKINGEPEFEFLDSTWKNVESVDVGIQYPNISSYTDYFRYFKRRIKAVSNYGSQHYSNILNIESPAYGTNPDADITTAFTIKNNGLSTLYLGIPSSTKETDGIKADVTYRRTWLTGIKVEANEGGDGNGITITGEAQTITLKASPKYTDQDITHFFLLNKSLPGWLYFEESLTSQNDITKVNQFGEKEYTIHILPNRTGEQRSVTLQICDRGMTDTLINYTITQNSTILTTSRELKSVVPILASQISGPSAQTIEIHLLYTWEDQYSINGSEYATRTYRELPLYSSATIKAEGDSTWFSIRNSNSKHYLEVSSNSESEVRTGQLSVIAKDDVGNTITGTLNIYQPSARVNVQRTVSGITVSPIDIGLSGSEKVPLELYSIGYKIEGTRTIKYGDTIVTEEGELFPETLQDLTISCSTSQTFDFSVPLSLIKKDPCGVEELSSFDISFYGVSQTMYLYQEENDVPFELDYSYIQVENANVSFIESQKAYGYHDLITDGNGTPASIKGNYSYVLHGYDNTIYGPGDVSVTFSGKDTKFKYVYAVPDDNNNSRESMYPDDTWTFDYNPEEEKTATLDELGNLLLMKDEYQSLLIWRLDNYNNTGDYFTVWTKKITDTKKAASNSPAIQYLIPLSINTGEVVISGNSGRITTTQLSGRQQELYLYVKGATQDQESSSCSLKKSGELTLIPGSLTGLYDENYGLSLQKPSIIKISNKTGSTVYTLTVVPRPLEGTVIVKDKSKEITEISSEAEPNSLETVRIGLELPKAIQISGINQDGYFGSVLGTFPGDGSLSRFNTKVSSQIEEPYFCASTYPVSVIARSLMEGKSSESSYYFAHNNARTVGTTFNPFSFFTLSDGIGWIDDENILLSRDYDNYTMNFGGVPFGVDVNNISVKNNITSYSWGSTRFSSKKVPPNTNSELVFYTYSIGTYSKEYGAYPEYQTEGNSLSISMNWGGYTGGTNYGQNLYNSGENFQIATVTFRFKYYSNNGILTQVDKNINFYYEGKEIKADLVAPSNGSLVLRTSHKDNKIGIVDESKGSWTGVGGTYPLRFTTEGNWMIYMKSGKGSWNFDGNGYSSTWSSSAGNSGYNNPASTIQVRVGLEYTSGITDLTGYTGTTTTQTNLARFEVLTSPRDTSNNVWVTKSGPSIVFRIGPALPYFTLYDYVEKAEVPNNGTLKFAYISSGPMLRACFSLRNCPYNLSTSQIQNLFAKSFSQSIGSTPAAVGDTEYHGDLEVYPPRDWSCKLVYVSSEDKYYITYYSVEDDITAISGYDGGDVGYFSIDLKDPYSIPGTSYSQSFTGKVQDSGHPDINTDINLNGVLLFKNDVYYDPYEPEPELDPDPELPELSPLPDTSAGNSEYYYLEINSSYGTHEVSDDGYSSEMGNKSGKYTYVLHCYDKSVSGDSDFIIQDTRGENSFYYVIATPDSYPGGYPDDSWEFTYNPDQARKATLNELGNLLKQNDEYTTLIIWRDNQENNNTGDRLIVYERRTKEWNLRNVVNPNSLEDLTYEFPQNGDGDSTTEQYKVMFITADGVSRDMTGITSTLTKYNSSGTSYRTETVQGSNLLSNLTNFMTVWENRVTVNIPGYVDQENTGAFHIFWRLKDSDELDSLPSLDPAQDDYDTEEEEETISYKQLFEITGIRFPSGSSTIYEIPSITSSNSDYDVLIGNNESFSSNLAELEVNGHTIPATSANIATNLGRYMTIEDYENKLINPNIRVSVNSDYDQVGDLEMYIRSAESANGLTYYVFPIMNYQGIFGSPSSMNSTADGGPQFAFTGGDATIDRVITYYRNGTTIKFMSSWKGYSLNDLYRHLTEWGTTYSVVAAFAGTNYGHFHFWWARGGNEFIPDDDF